MKSNEKTREQLLIELHKLKSRIAELEEYLSDHFYIEQVIERTNNEWEYTFDAVPDLIAIIDRNYRITRVNKAMAKRLGMTPQQAIGLTCYEYIHGTENPPEFCPLCRLIDTKNTITVESHEKKLGGHFLLSISPFFNPEGLIIGTIHVAHDITVRKKAEDALLEMMEFTENLINNSSVPTFVINKEHKVIYWNKACEKLTGIMATDILGTDNQYSPFYRFKRPTLADIIIDGNYEELAKWYPVYKKSDAIPDGIHGEGWFPSPGGKELYILFEAAPIYNRKGELVAAIETLRDITERTKVLERNEELVKELSEAIAKVKKLSGFLPICASCKKIRDDKGYWNQIEAYIRDHSEAEFSHSICPECATKLYPDIFK